MIAYPQTEAQAVDVVFSAATQHKALKISGGGTPAAYNPNEEGIGLSSHQICGIVAYEPAELVMTVKAGTPVAEVEAALAANHQMMAFEP